MPTCPVCANEVPPYESDRRRGDRIQCLTCGTYRLMEYAEQILGQLRQYSPGHVVIPNRRLSAAIRMRTEEGEEPVVDDPGVVEREFQPQRNH